MAFRGLFIGIDRYISAGIDELSCARRDAVALEALFADTLGGRTVLLTDEAATRAKGAEALGGKGGGGRPDMAQAGGPDGSRADAALEAIASAIGAG
jgi:ATP-dependent DNA helicase